MLANLAQYDQMLYEKRRETSQATRNTFFSKASPLDASASDEPPASDEPQPGTSTDGFTCIMPSLSDIDDPDVVSFAPSSSNSLPQPQQAKTSGHFWRLLTVLFLYFKMFIYMYYFKICLHSSKFTFRRR